MLFINLYQPTGHTSCPKCHSCKLWNQVTSLIRTLLSVPMHGERFNLHIWYQSPLKVKISCGNLQFPAADFTAVVAGSSMYKYGHGECPHKRLYVTVYYMFTKGSCQQHLMALHLIIVVLVTIKCNMLRGARHMSSKSCIASCSCSFSYHYPWVVIHKSNEGPLKATQGDCMS